MFKRSSQSVALLVVAALLAGCTETTAPTADRAPLFNNSAAAHACQQLGYLNLFRSDHTPFRNTGECVSYAAHGGVFVTRQTATFTNIFYQACNDLSLGYELDGSTHILESVSPGCGAATGGTYTINYFSDQTLRVFLRDNTCGYTFYEDSPHGTKVGANPYQISITDAGGFCESPPEDPRPGANVTLTETITP
jgi:hypothetical protein